MAGGPGPDEGWVNPVRGVSDIGLLLSAIERLTGKRPKKSDPAWEGVGTALNAACDRLDDLDRRLKDLEGST